MILLGALCIFIGVVGSSPVAFVVGVIMVLVSALRGRQHGD